MEFSVTNSYMEWFKSMKPIAWGVHLNAKNVKITNTIVDAMADGPMHNGVNFPFNTDGFDISGENIEIADSTIDNGDDAFSVGSPSTNVWIHGGSAGFQCHGLSVGSLGQNLGQWNNVSNIVFEDFTISNSLYGSRFKSWVGGEVILSLLSPFLSRSPPSFLLEFVR